jgi:hypothetical protein
MRHILALALCHKGNGTNLQCGKYTEYGKMQPLAARKRRRLVSKIEKALIEKLIAHEERMHKAITPMPEAFVVASFLHLQPHFIVRRCEFNDDYCLDRVWPEVILVMDFDTATRLKEKLEAIWKKVAPNVKACSCAKKDSAGLTGNTHPISVYRVEKYNDEALYEYVHRVPTSLRNLKKLEHETGYRAVSNIIEV